MKLTFRVVQLLLTVALIGITGVVVSSLQPTERATAAQLSPTCTANAPVREFFVVTGEWDTTLKGHLKDRGKDRQKDEKLERYTFDPATIIVHVGDCVVLRIHDLKGSHHNVTIEGTGIDSAGAPIIDDSGTAIGTARARPNPNAAFEGPADLKDGEFARGEQIELRFQADQPGTFRIICEVHTFIGSNGELKGYDDSGKPMGGPMVGYLVVLPR